MCPSRFPKAWRTSFWMPWCMTWRATSRKRKRRIIIRHCCLRFRLASFGHRQAHVVKLRFHDFLPAFRANAVAEPKVGMGANVFFYPVPVILIVADTLAVAANGQEALQMIYP